jgi:hypothetical protein
LEVGGGEARDLHRETLRGSPIGSLHEYRFALPVAAPGRPMTVELRASQPDGSARSAYARVRRRSFVERHGVALLVGAAVVAGGGAVAGMRRRRSRERRRRRENPYVAGSPVLDERLFVGRDELMQSILQTLHNNSVLLFGERRIGKTSLQHQLRRRLSELDDPRFRFHPVFVDVQGTSQERFFATIADEVLDQLGEALGREEAERRRRRTASPEYGYRDLVRELRWVVGRLRDVGPKEPRLVLLIDEVDQLNDYEPRVNQRLRSLFMKSFAESLVAVVSGVAIKKEWESEGSPWYNFFEEIEVGELSEEAARELVVAPARGLVRYDAEAVDRIVELARRRPYAVQRLAMNVLRRMHEEGRYRVRIEDVEALARSSAHLP